MKGSVKPSALTSSARIPSYAYSMPFVGRYRQINTTQWVAVLHVRLFINIGEIHGKNGIERCLQDAAQHQCCA